MADKRLTYGIDRSTHSVMAWAMNARNIQRGESGRTCNHCGEHPDVYYCEEGLYLVRCLRCRMAALVYARNPDEAVERTIGG